MGLEKCLRASWKLHLLSGQQHNVSCVPLGIDLQWRKLPFAFQVFALINTLHEFSHVLWCGWAIVGTTRIKRMILNMVIRWAEDRRETR